MSALADDVYSVKSPLAEVPAHLKSTAPDPAASPPVAPATEPSAPDFAPVSAPVPRKRSSILELFIITFPRGPLQPCLLLCRSGRPTVITGKLNVDVKPPHIPPFPSKRFITEDEGIFGQIKAAGTREGWESEVLWNIGNNTENALSSSHKVFEALAANDVAAATEAFAVLNHHIPATHERINERLDFSPTHWN